jgi:hypothetical protein
LFAKRTARRLRIQFSIGGRCCATFDLPSSPVRRPYFLGLDLSLRDQTQSFFMNRSVHSPPRIPLPCAACVLYTCTHFCSTHTSPGKDDPSRSTSIGSSVPHLGFWAWGFRGFVPVTSGEKKKIQKDCHQFPKLKNR